MTNSKKDIIQTACLVILFAACTLFARGQKNELSKAIDFFINGKYTEAESLLNNLLREHPDNLLVNYYYGACRTETKHYGQEEQMYLLTGSLGEVPNRVWYYLGVQYQAAEKWNEAILSYKSFKQVASPSESDSLHIEERIAQCRQKKNPFVEQQPDDILPQPLPQPNKSDTVSKETSFQDSAATNTLLQVVKADTTPQIPSPQPMEQRENINFRINETFTYLSPEHFRTEEGRNYWEQGRTKEKHIEQLEAKLDSLRKQYSATNDYLKRQELGTQILETENELFPLRQEIEQLDALARNAENTYWKDADETEKKAFEQELENYLFPAIPDELLVLPDSLPNSEPPTTPASAFAATDPSPADSQTNQLVYKIQLGAYSKGLPAYVERLFKKLSYIRKIEHYTDENGVVVYTTGNLTNLKDALLMQEQVRQEGVEGAFVVPYLNGKRITLKEAKKIEAEK